MKTWTWTVCIGTPVRNCGGGFMTKMTGTADEAKAYVLTRTKLHQNWIAVWSSTRKGYRLALLNSKGRLIRNASITHS